MKKILPYSLLVLIVIMSFNSCKKNYSHEIVKQSNDTIPNLNEKVVSSVSGFVTNELGQPMYGATVYAGNDAVNTDMYGYFNISNASLSKIAGFIKVSKAGYFFSYKTFMAKAGKDNFVRVEMIPKVNVGNVDAIAGGTVATNNASITLPANGVMVATDSTAYTGTVYIAAKWIDPTDVLNSPLKAIGDGRGIDLDGHLNMLHAFGSLAVELTGDAGQLLQIANGKQATLSLPIATTIASTATNDVMFWSFNESNGLWKQEAVATKLNNSYTGQVSHFSFWEGAIGIPLVNFSVQVVDANLNPLTNVPVMLTLQGQPYNCGYGSFGYTDAKGFAQGSVFANSSMILDVLTTCHTTAYSHNFTTTNADFDMGTITGNAGQSSVTLTGTVNNCSGQPVTDGYVQTYDNGFYNRIYINNGAFNFTGLACTNAPTTFVAIDNTTNEQSTPQTITLTPGHNNLGLITACGTSTVGKITYTIDGITNVLIEPADTLAGYLLTGNITQVLKVSETQNVNPQMSFQFDGGNAVGSGHGVSEIFSTSFPGNRGVATPALPVTITEYGAVGGFMSGSFSGTAADFSTGAPHTISCTFRVRRAL